MGFVERGTGAGPPPRTASGASALAGRASVTPARASVQTESPRVQLLALRSPDRAAHSPERRLPRVRRVLYLVGAIVFVDTMFFAALTPLLPQYAAEFGIGKTGGGCCRPPIRRARSSGRSRAGWSPRAPASSRR